MPIRMLSRLLHDFLSQWRRGRIEAVYREQEWVLKRGLASERRKFRLALEAIDDLRRQAARAFANAPWAKSEIARLLRERLEALPGTATRKSDDERDKAA